MSPEPSERSEPFESSEPSERVLAIAAAVSDRHQVDWEHEEADIPEQASTLRHLREIARVAALLGGPGDDSAEQTLLFRWGPLEVLERIGEGSYGEVYRARDPVLGREVALKLRRPGPADAEYSNRAFVEEARRLARIDHPNVVRVLGADVHDGRVGLWTELLEGANLAEILGRDGRLAPSEAVTVGIEMCRALAAVHAAGIVHGDLKAENVIRARDGRLVLTDFGAGSELTTVNRGSRSGTPLAMAPELLEGGGPNERTDLYSLGVLLYWLLAGRHPVEAATLEDLRRKHRSAGATPLLDVRPELPPALVEVVERALAPTPEARFTSAGQAERRLRGVLAGSAARDGRVSGAPPWARVWVAVTVGGTLALAAIAAWAWLSKSGVSAPAAPIERQSVERQRSEPFTSATEPAVEAGSAPAATEAGVSSRMAETTGLDGLDVAPVSPPRVPVSLALRRSGLAPPEILDTGSSIAPGDQLFLEVVAEREVHLYVLNQDLAGELFVLFPLEGVPPENPLPPGRAHRLPGSRDGMPLDWQVTSAGGTESFLFVISEHRLDELEAELASVESAALGRRAEHGGADGPVLRGVGGLAAARASGSGEDRLGALSRWLQGLRAEGAPVWVERIDLSNP
ncbi:MAG TPA: protein kinase [Thermoanaerobaculia bacterium]|nr:protein kinase [Thermoanaerobaculia bacterium]